MMYIIYNHDGSIKEKNLTDFIQQGDNLTKEIAVAIIGYNPIVYSLIGTFKLPDDSQVVLTSDEEVTITDSKGQEYSGVKIALTEEVTALEGIVKANIQAVNTSDKVLTSYTTYITINEGVSPDAIAMMSQKELHDLIALIGINVTPDETIVVLTSAPTSPSGFELGQIAYYNYKFYKLESDGWTEIFDLTDHYTKTDIDRFITSLNTAISQKSYVTGTVENNKWKTLSITNNGQTETHDIGGSGGGGTEYQAGTGITISDDTISVDFSEVASQDDIQNVREVAEGKCNSFTVSYQMTLDRAKSKLSAYGSFYVYNSTTKMWENKRTELLAGDYDSFADKIINDKFNSQDEYFEGTYNTHSAGYLIVGTDTTLYFLYAGHQAAGGGISRFPLHNGDIFICVERLDSNNKIIPDRWYESSSSRYYQLETSLVDLTLYPTFSDVNSILADIIGYDGVYSSSKTYEVGDIVIYNNKIYKCTTAVSSAESFDNAKWTETNIGSLISEIDLSSYATKTMVKGLIGDEYDNTATYSVGDYVIYNNTLYRCTTAVSTAEDFDSTKWTACKLADVMVDLDTAQTITGEKTFVNKIFFAHANPAADIKWYLADNTFGDLELFRQNSRQLYFNASGIIPNENNTKDLGQSSRKWKDLYLSGKIKDGTNEFNADNVFNVINASDIVNNTLTQAQYDLITNGKPTRIIGTFLNFSNLVIYKASDSTFLFIGYNNGPSRPQIGSIYLNASTKYIGIYAADSRQLDLRNILQFNGKTIPAYPSSPSAPQVFTYDTDDSLKWLPAPSGMHLYMHTFSVPVLDGSTTVGMVTFALYKANSELIGRNEVHNLIGTTDEVYIPMGGYILYNNAFYFPISLHCKANDEAVYIYGATSSGIYREFKLSNLSSDWFDHYRQMY